MRVKRLEIERKVWKTGNPLEGEIRFENDFGEVCVKLDDAKCREMLAVVADAMVAQAQSTAAILRDNIIEHIAATKLIEDQAA